MNEKNKAQSILILELWDTILKETQKLMTQSEEEAKNLNEKGLSLLIVSEQANDLTRNLKEETKKLQFLMTQNSDVLRSNMENCFSNMLQAIEKINMLSLNGKVEATRVREAGTDFRVIFEELYKLTEEMNKVMMELKWLILGSEDVSPEKSILELLNKANNRVNLLALNYVMEAARLGENGVPVAVISDELKKLTNSIHTLTNQLGHVLQIQK